MKITLIITTKNESKVISDLLQSIAKQTRSVDAVLIADASDDTATREAIFSSEHGIPTLKTTVEYLSVGNTANRALGRNKAIEQADDGYILITDAGCRLKNTWVEEMMKGFEEAEVVAGFYESDAKSVFEKCVAPYALVMPDKIDTKNFLPATRSMGITKKMWKKLGGFNEKYRYAEDYEFARRIQKAGKPIAVVPKAIVYWRPRQTLSSFARMIFEHAYGDGYSKTYRPKVLTIYLRYLFIAFFFAASPFLGTGALVAYAVFAVMKNFRYVQHVMACVYLPVLQFVSDWAVMYGTLKGLADRSLTRAA